MTRIKSIIPACISEEELNEFMREGGDITPNRIALDAVAKGGPVLDEDLDDLRDYIKDNMVYEPSPVSESSIGFVGLDDPLSCHTDGKTITIIVERRERVLPNDVVERMVAQKVKEKCEREDLDRISSKERRDIKSDIRAALLPKSHVRARRFHIAIFHHEGMVWFMLLNASGQAADKVNKFLRDTLLSDGLLARMSYPAIEMPKGLTLCHYMHAIVKSSIETNAYKFLQEQVEPCDYIKLNDSERGSVTFKPADGDFTNAFFDYAQQGYQVTDLGVLSSIEGSSWSTFFKLSNKGRFYGFSTPGDALVEQFGDLETPEAIYDAELFLSCHEVIRHIKLARKACGDE